MGSRSRQKISNVCIIICLMYTFGSQLAIAQEAIVALNEKPILLEVEPEDDKTNSDLDQAASNDTPQLEILRRIRKLNNNGSYAVGYETNDRTFKIESRDVLGNVKGSFGYVDINGEIKRVSYSVNNETEAKPTIPKIEEGVNISRFNRSVPSQTVRRLPQFSTTASPTRATVIQAIPRRLKILSASADRPFFKEYAPPTKTSISKPDSTTTVVYATSVPTPKSYTNIRPTPLSLTNKLPEQIARPEELQQNTKVQNMDSSSAKPVTEEIDERNNSQRESGALNLRRQLMHEAEQQNESRHQIVYSQSVGDDSSHIYGPASSTARPLFTTTSSARIPSVVLAARQKTTQIQNRQHNNGQASPEKYYIKATRSRAANRETDAHAESMIEQPYVTQNPIAVQIPSNTQGITEPKREQLRTQVEQIDAINGRFRTNQFIAVHPTPPTIRSASYRPPQLVKFPISQRPLQSREENEQYLRETTPSRKNEESEDSSQTRGPQLYYTTPVSATQHPYYIYSQQNEQDVYQPHVSTWRQPQAPLIYRGNPYGNEQYNNPDRPLTTRDFERLLHLLIYRHQELERLSQLRLKDPNFDRYLPYPPYSRIPPYNYFNTGPHYRTPVNMYPDPENVYQAQSPLPTVNPGMSYELQRLIPRTKQLNPTYFGAQRHPYNLAEYDMSSAASVSPSQNTQSTYLPPEVREELLYRMLMLALQTETQDTQAQTKYSVDAETSKTTISPVVYKKPVRSVQIIGEE